MEIAIQAQNLGKAYRVQGMAPPTLYGSLSRWFSGKEQEKFWALRDVTFTIPAGRTVGVIGPNGSGKSSTLGLIAGTITPTTGFVRTQGRISSLLELGAGFHPDLTGRENVMLNAAILGIPREAIRRRMDHIIEFAGLRDFIDMPVKHYSSGMYVRLGFAVAIEMNPDILLVDEVLAVGDVAFQMKCLDRIRKFQQAGKTLLFVSHALETVQEFCDDVILIHEGRMMMMGPPDEVIFNYLQSYMVRLGHLNVEEHGTREVEMSSVRLLNDAGEEVVDIESGKAFTVEIRYQAKQRIERPVFGFNIKTGNGFYVFGSNTQIEGVPVEALDGEGRVKLTFSPLWLKKGNYFLSLSVHSWDHSVQYHRREDWHPFKVSDRSKAPGLVHLPHQWHHHPESKTNEP